MYKVTEALRANIDILRMHVYDMNDTEYKLFAGINTFIKKSGKVSFKQMQVLGRLYKKHVQRGVYKHHNWKIWK